MAGKQVEFGYEDFVFTCFALDSKIKEYRGYIEQERKRPYSKEREERLNTYNYFLRQYEFAKKAVMGISAQRESEKEVAP